MKRVIGRTAALAATGLMAMAFAASPAFAGSQVVTGDDEHCEHGDTESPSICDTTRKYLQYARAGHCPMVYVPGPYASIPWRPELADSRALGALAGGSLYPVDSKIKLKKDPSGG